MKTVTNTNMKLFLLLFCTIALFKLSTFNGSFPQLLAISFVCIVGLVCAVKLVKTTK